MNKRISVKTISLVLVGGIGFVVSSMASAVEPLDLPLEPSGLKYVTTFSSTGTFTEDDLKTKSTAELEGQLHINSNSLPPILPDRLVLKDVDTTYDKPDRFDSDWLHDKLPIAFDDSFEFKSSAFELHNVKPASGGMGIVLPSVFSVKNADTDIDKEVDKRTKEFEELIGTQMVNSAITIQAYFFYLRSLK